MTTTTTTKELLNAPRGANFVVVGAGRTGLAAARLLLQEQAIVTLTDDRDAESLAANTSDVDGLTIVGGGIAIDASADVVVLSPGVPRAHPQVQSALARGTPVVNEIEVALGVLGVFAGRHRVAVAAITGTNGKSTTTSLLGAILVHQDPNAFVGGNLGRPLCEAVIEGERPTTLALELSSYQLETIEHLPVRAAVVTNLSPDHLDRYRSESAYYAAKANIFDLVTERGGISLNGNDARSQEHLADKGAARTRFDFAADDAGNGVSIDGMTLRIRTGANVETIALTNPKIVGPHNVENAAAAVAAAALLGVPPTAWREGLAAYEGIAHRMEVLDTIAGVTFVNDSKATNVDAAAVAVKSFSRGVHLIVGGVGKGSAYAPLVTAAQSRAVAAYTIGADAASLALAFGETIPCRSCETLALAFADAVSAALPGDVVLLAPACASFDQFPNYLARGDAFRGLVDAHRLANADAAKSSNRQIQKSQSESVLADEHSVSPSGNIGEGA